MSPETGLVDYDALAAQADLFKPAMIIWEALLTSSGITLDSARSLIAVELFDDGHGAHFRSRGR